MNYFDDPNSKHFSFESFATGLAEETFGVINFKGYEAISETYDFEIMLVSSKKDIDLEDVLQAQAVFTIHRAADDNVLYNGILAEFDQLHEVNDVIFYRARLVPKLWWLTLTHHNQVFLSQSVTSFVEDALRDGGLDTADFDIGALTGYEDIDYTCQYDESHFNFVSRWLERQGIYYYFTQEADGEVLVLTDTKFSHESLKQGAELFYNPASGLEGKHLGEAIGTFTCRQKQLPKQIILKDYNYEHPSLDITSHADVDSGGRGVLYIYGESFLTPEDGERLAHIRAEELLCKKQEFFGESTVPYIMPGFKFNLNNHYREDFNQEYLILEVTHEGNQSHLMSGGISTEAGKSKNQAIYRNSFKAIPNDVQYRPERVTEKPKISGTIHAHIDSEVDGEYAQIDEQGRYRVKLPFDINDEHMDGKGSAPIRMMQPYAGKKRGMQFPLAKGTEVLLTFIEGNPDRPVIAGAVSNPETQGPVSANNQSESVIQTGGNNRIRMEDKVGSERMVLESPVANSWIRIGSTNDPITLDGPAQINCEVGVPVVIGDAIDEKDVVPSLVITKLSGGDYTDAGNVAVSGTDYTQAGNDYTFLTEGDYRFQYTSGTDTATRRVYVGADAFNQDNSNKDGIRIRTAGLYWNEGLSRVGDFIGGPLPTNAAKRVYSHKNPTHTNPQQIGNLLANFEIGGGYRPTGLLSRYNADDTATSSPIPLDIDTAMLNAHVSVNSMDTFTTQEGNVYDFGGCWNYNLGNGYTENHINQSARLNQNAKAYNDADEKLGLINDLSALESKINEKQKDYDDGGIGSGGSYYNDLVKLKSDRDALKAKIGSASTANQTQIKTDNAQVQYDLLDAGGPVWNAIIWPDAKGSDTKLTGDFWSNNLDSSKGGKVCAEKSWVNSYEYTQGDSISVSVGESLSVVYSGLQIEVEYDSDGNISKWTKGSPGNGDTYEKQWTPLGIKVLDSHTIAADSFISTDEKKFDRNTGDLCAHSLSQGTGMGMAKFDFDYSNTVAMTVNSGSLISSETHLGARISNENFIGGLIEIKMFLGLKIENHVGLGGIIETKNTKYEICFPGTSLEGDTNVIDTHGNNIKLLATSLKSLGTEIGGKGSDIEAIASVKLIA